MRGARTFALLCAMARQDAPQQRRIQPKSWWVRLLAALAICLLGAQGVLPSLHQTLVSHRICAEHGELVEAHHSDGAAQIRAAAAASAAPEAASAVRVAAESDHDEHCDCALGAFLSGSEARRADAIVLAAPELGPVSKVVAANAAARPEILSFAPKLSPPA